MVPSSAVELSLSRPYRLRSRIVVFLRNWTLTLYVAPFALAKPSYWSLAIILAALTADWRLQQAIAELLSPTAAPLGRSITPYLNRYALLIASLLVTSGAMIVLIGVTTLFAALGLWMIACTAIAMMDRSLLGSIQWWLENAPRHKDGTIEYPTLIGGPLLLLFFTEPIRLATAALIIVAIGEVRPMLFGSLGLVIIAAAYWTMAPIAVANDEFRARASGEPKDGTGVAHSDPTAGQG